MRYCLVVGSGSRSVSLDRVFFGYFEFRRFRERYVLCCLRLFWFGINVIRRGGESFVVFENCRKFVFSVRT